jgi:hypothetical protein
LQGAVAHCSSQQSNRESNVKNAKAKVATGATVVVLAGLTGLALSQGSSAPSKQVADKPIVHTRVIRRTVHVTKHAKPKHPGGAGSTAGGTAAASVVTSTSSTGGEAAPVATSSSGGGEVIPVTTASSGSGGGGGEAESDSGGEIEHEGGDD